MARKIPTTTPRKPYYRYDIVSDSICTVDLLWIAKAVGHSVAETGDLQARLDQGEVFVSRWARFAKHAETF